MKTVLCSISALSSTLASTHSTVDDHINLFQIHRATIEKYDPVIEGDPPLNQGCFVNQNVIFHWMPFLFWVNYRSNQLSQTKAGIAQIDNYIQDGARNIADDQRELQQLEAKRKYIIEGGHQNELNLMNTLQKMSKKQNNSYF